MRRFSLFARPSRRGLPVRLAVLTLVLLPVASWGSPQQRPDQRPTFDASVARVRVDVIVTADGDFVDDLRVEDFVLFEDGDEQPILSLQVVDLLPAESAAEEGVESGPGDGREGVVGGDATIRNHNPSDLAAMVYVVNSLGVGCRGMSRFARQWGRMYEDVDTVAIPTTVYLIDFLGYVHELTSYTHDAAELRKASEKLRGKSLFGGAVDPVYEANFGGTCFGSPIALPPRRSFDVLKAITDSLAARPGRKALIWVSYNISMADRGVLRGRRADEFDVMRGDDVQEAFERSANSSGVSVYGVDPGLVTWHTSRSSAASSSGPVDGILRDPFAGGSFSASRNYLNEVSRNTGGKAFIRWGNMQKAVRQIQRQAGRFYLLTYALPAPHYDGDYHEIRVEVRRRDVDVRSRDGYYDISDDERALRIGQGRALIDSTSPLWEMSRR